LFLQQGIDEAVQLMPVGAIWKVSIPGNLAFGQAGRGASPGKPRIAPMATVEYVLELAGLPGKEVDLMEVIGDS
jgi:peptidylprolyl isomerase